MPEIPDASVVLYIGGSFKGLVLHGNVQPE